MKTLLNILVFIGKGILILIGSLIIGYYLIVKETPKDTNDYSLVPASMLKKDSSQKAESSHYIADVEAEYEQD